MFIPDFEKIRKVSPVAAWGLLICIIAGGIMSLIKLIASLLWTVKH